MSENNSTHSNPRGRQSKSGEQTGLLGIGLDGHDGHERVTKGDDFLLVGGSEDTHERMQELVIRVEERLKRKGKTIRDVDGPEFEDVVRDSLE